MDCQTESASEPFRVRIGWGLVSINYLSFFQSTSERYTLRRTVCWEEFLALDSKEASEQQVTVCENKEAEECFFLFETFPLCRFIKATTIIQDWLLIKLELKLTRITFRTSLKMSSRLIVIR